jgi:hypothetical protein
VGGLWLAYLLWDLKRHPPLPSHDANQQAALHLLRLELEQAARTEEAGHV